jgi:hypothetical protein
MIPYEAAYERDFSRARSVLVLISNQEEKMQKTLLAATLIAALGFASVGAFAADDATTTTKETKTSTKTEKKTKKAPKKAAKTTTTTSTKAE